MRSGLFFTNRRLRGSDEAPYDGSGVDTKRGLPHPHARIRPLCASFFLLLRRPLARGFVGGDRGAQLFELPGLEREALGRTLFGSFADLTEKLARESVAIFTRELEVGERRPERPHGTPN